MLYKNIYSNLYTFRNIFSGNFLNKMANDRIDINFLYLIVAIIVLIFVYNMLSSTQNYIRDKKIIVETEKNTYLMPYDACDTYLTNIKKNMHLLYKSSDRTKCKNLQSYIDRTYNQLNGFTKYDIKANDADLLRYDLVNELDMLKSEDFKSQKAFVNILLSIEYILYMLRTSSCPNKKLSLISLHKLMKELYDNRCSDVLSYSDIYDTEFFDNRDIEVAPADIVESAKALNKRPIVAQEMSQDITYDMNGEEFMAQAESISYKVEMPQKNKINKKDLVSQDFDCSSDYILTYKGSQPYVPFCDINKLRNEREKLKTLTTDLTFSRSLRNDYDYLDEN